MLLYVNVLYWNLSGYCRMGNPNTHTDVHTRTHLQNPIHMLLFH
jgi:hypothetical protein